MLLYWQTGRDILERQNQQGWGAKVVDRLADDLRREFPEITGFSSRNLKYMRLFADTWMARQFVQRVVAQIPWALDILPLKDEVLLRVLISLLFSMVYVQKWERSSCPVEKGKSGDTAKFAGIVRDQLHPQ